MMSSLSYLEAYGSDSEVSDHEEIKVELKKKKLPKPNLAGVATVQEDSHKDEPDLHNGRIRNFPHVRGNWATFVCIKYPVGEYIDKIVKQLTNKLTVDDLNICEDYHISLSKTVVLKYHMITTFTNSIRLEVQNNKKFNLAFDLLEVFCNEDRTRTFLSLRVDVITEKELLQLTSKIDHVLEDFGLPTFYDNPSFHASILWVNGDKSKEIKEQLKSITNIILPERVLIESVFCKVGNKQFQYTLT